MILSDIIMQSGTTSVTTAAALLILGHFKSKSISDMLPVKAQYYNSV